MPGRGFRYGATSEPNDAITSDQEIPWLSGRLVVGFVATAAISQVVAMVALVATKPTLVATEPTLVATVPTLVAGLGHSRGTIDRKFNSKRGDTRIVARILVA